MAACSSMPEAGEPTELGQMRGTMGRHTRSLREQHRLLQGDHERLAPGPSALAKTGPGVLVKSGPLRRTTRLDTAIGSRTRKRFLWRAPKAATAPTRGAYRRLSVRQGRPPLPRPMTGSCRGPGLPCLLGQAANDAVRGGGSRNLGGPVLASRGGPVLASGEAPGRELPASPRPATGAREVRAPLRLDDARHDEAGVAPGSHAPARAAPRTSPRRSGRGGRWARSGCHGSRP